MFDDYESQYPYAADGRFPGGGDTGLLEPLTALTYLAAVTDRIRLGTGICLVPQRNPVYTAKQVVDLDNLSGGRVDFGIGVGWLQEEFEVVAAPFEQRGARTDEYLQVMRALWTDEVVVVRGRALRRCPSAACTRSRCRRPHPPIHVGGESNAALRRVARHGQGWYSFNRLPEDLDEPLARLDDLLAAEGRTPRRHRSSPCARTSSRWTRAPSRATGRGASTASWCSAWPSTSTCSKSQLDKLATTVLEQSRDRPGRRGVARRRRAAADRRGRDAASAARRRRGRPDRGPGRGVPPLHGRGQPRPPAHRGHRGGRASGWSGGSTTTTTTRTRGSTRTSATSATTCSRPTAARASPHGPSGSSSAAGR